MIQTQGLLGIAFFQATALIILLVLFLLFRRDISSYFRLWIGGWICFTLTALCEVFILARNSPDLWRVVLLGNVVALLVFAVAVVQFTTGARRRNWHILWLAGLVLLAVFQFERHSAPQFGSIRWETAVLISVIYLWVGVGLWRSEKSRRSHGARLLAGCLLLSGLHGLDRWLWLEHPLFLLRVAFDHLLGVALGIAMVVVVLEGARSRTEELNEKLRRLTLLTTASTQTLSVQEVLHRVLLHLVESLGATHGLVRLLEGEGEKSRLVVKAAVGFQQDYLRRHGSVPAREPWSQRVLQKDCVLLRYENEQDPSERQRMAESGTSEIVSLALHGKQGPLGIIAVGSRQSMKFRPDEITYLTNIANLLGLTLENVRLFEQVATVQQQWAYTFDSIGDPIFVHDPQGRILRCNQRMGHLLGREARVQAGRSVSELLFRKDVAFQVCPYCEKLAGQGDNPDPWLPGYFLASNSSFTNPAGNVLGTVHVLKDISERKRAEEKYRTLVANVQEGVFISTPQGRFLDFNDAFLRMTGYDSREELLSADIPSAIYANPAERERLKKLLQEHGSVTDFEFEMRRKDGEIRTALESSIVVRGADGNIMAYQGFLLDITERKRAEREIRRRNRELMILNSIAQTLTESMDLSDSLHRTLRQMAEMFGLDATSLFLFDAEGKKIRRVAAAGHRTEYARHFPPVAVQPELVQHIKSVHATFLSVQGLPLPAIFREAQRKEELASAYIVVLWSKDRVLGALVVGSRAPRDFSPSDVNLLIAVGSQISSAIERSTLYEETRQAYENLRRTQEQLLQSEKMAAVGQLISGVAHELNNPLTAILGYTQLLTSSGQLPAQGAEFADKLYKQAQRTHRIVQNLLSFARQHKPERVLVRINQVIEETLALRDYDLRMNNIRVHLDVAPDLPLTSADPHQLQQVFLNVINNAVDAIMERSNVGDLWVRTGTNGGRLFIEFTDSGPGVKEASRVFDPFYTTKPVGKGTGLGLSICYGIVTEHGGTIQVRNVPPRGAAFLIELPFYATVSDTSSLQNVPSNSRKEARILLVDSDPSVLEALETVLRGQDHHVQSAKTADDAVELLEKQEFDLIVAAVEVESTEGRKSLHHWLEARNPLLAKRCVWMRPVECTKELSDLVPQNGRRVLQKPFETADLLAEVDAALTSAQATPVER